MKPIRLSKPLVSPLLKTEYTQLTTPRAYAPKGTQPDPSAPKKYTVNFLLNPENPEHADFMAKVEGAWEDLEERIKIAEGKQRLKLLPDHLPWSEDEDDEGNPTGLLKLRAGRQATGDGPRGPWEFVLPIVDMQKSAISAKEGDLARGSILRFSATPKGFESKGAYGMVLELAAVQVQHAEYFQKDQGADVFESFDEAELPTTGCDF